MGEVPKSSVWVPLVVSGRATGAISLQNVERERAYSEVDLRLLTTLAGSLSVALENARLFEETRQRNAELALINDVQRGLAENLEMQAMYDLVGDRLQSRSSTHRWSTSACSTGLRDDHASRTRSSEASATPSTRMRAQCGSAEHVLGVARAAPVRRARRGTARRAAAARACWGRADAQVHGAAGPARRRRRGDRRISLQNLDREHAFSEADVRLLTTLAGSLSVALENARLFEETRQRNAELALINDVQRSLAENLEMHAMYELIGDRLQEIFDAQVVDIGVLDQESGKLRFPYSIERGIRYPDEEVDARRPGWLRHAGRGSRS